MLFAGHVLLANVAQEMELDEDEARKVTLALDRVMAHYQVQPTPTQKVWMNFVGVLSGVYGPRAVAIYKRLQRERGKGATVSHLRPAT